MVFAHVLRWRRHCEVMLNVVSNPQIWLIDGMLLIVGAAFLALALLVH